MEEFLRQYGPIGIFLGAGFEGQTALLVGGILARQHILPLWLVLACATAGSGLVDHMLFVAGRRFKTHRWVVRATRQAAFAKALAFIEKYPISYILAFRFIFGLRIASPIAVGVSKVPTWRFTALNIAGAAIWATAFTLAGFIFGEAVHNLLGHGHHAGRWTLIVAGAIVAFVAVFGTVRHLLRRRQAVAQTAAEDN
ncbi:MAG TPA: DedA family protein [Phenylobacterium sp.]|jgi:membrane protein DedA with SNARE-associated domain|uniref:DedA family protein n=1 Tax=Phenylobacterium sp. TaxID=1871053 RepID=UPI002BE2F5C2|nr:DedA family protein [Phenylobacterium sp.]HXA40354.1 DedA family protein [Phenylobacterium sp.]